MSVKKNEITGGYQPRSSRGYQPTKSNLDPNNPPKGGSGVSRPMRGAGQTPTPVQDDGRTVQTQE